MKRLAWLAALSASTIALSTGASFADYTLNILHINDWHSRIESNNKYESTCSTEEEEKGECIGGAARLVTAINDRRKALEGQNVLLLNAGDNFQGSLFYTTYKGAAEAEFLNLMKFDAMAVGNHEFDDGEDALVPFLEKVEFPVLSANVHPNAQSKVGDRIKPSIVLDVGGEKIGIVGAVTNDTPEIAAPGPNISIANDIENITAEVEKLKAEGINKIIALTHVGYVRDMEAIAKIPGVDVVVGGHSHTLLHNSDPKAEGPYPTMVDNPEGYKVPVTQAASYSKYLGEFKVVFDDNGVVKEASGDPLYLDQAIKPDEAVLARVKELAGPIEDLKARLVSETTKEIDGSRDNCRARECEMGNLVADAMLDRVKDQGIQIAVQNGGGLRASIDAGEITMGEVLTVLPFQNTLATFQLTGKDIVASLEAGVSEIEEGKGKFPQVAGLRYSFDQSVSPNEGRVKDVQVNEGGEWKPIEPEKLYGVVTNNFVRQGGDGYKLFAENAQNAYDYGPGLEQVVADYLAENRPYTPKIDGRITEVAQSTTEEEQPESEAPASEAPAAATPSQEPAAQQQTEEQPGQTAGEAPAGEAAVTTPELPAGSETLATQPPAVTQEQAPAAAPAPEPAQQGQAAEQPQQPAVDAGAGEATTPELPAGSETLATQPPTVTQDDAPASESAAAPSTAEQASASGTQTHTVARGDNLWKIAVQYYGDGMQWHRLREANPDINPDRLAIGATLSIPPAN